MVESAARESRPLERAGQVIMQIDHVADRQHHQPDPPGESDGAGPLRQLSGAFPGEIADQRTRRALGSSTQHERPDRRIGDEIDLDRGVRRDGGGTLVRRQLAGVMIELGNGRDR